MSTYVKAYGGYIADVPRLWFKRCDGRIFYFDELTQATVTPQVNYTEVNAGWSLYPVAYLPGQGTFEMQITSGKFEADLFAMTNATNFVENTAYRMPMTETLSVGAENKVELAHAAVEGSVSISGMEETDGEVATGKFKVTTDGNKTTVAFFAGDIADTVTVSYEYNETVQEANIDNKSSAMGEAVLKYPVYGSGDDCTDSAIIGYLMMRVYKARVTAQPGLDGSYKTASTYQFTLAAMDAKRPDEATYSIAYIRN